MENGIKPKYSLGQEVYKVAWWDNTAMEKTKIRKIIVSKDGLSYRYKVNGHTEYTFTDEQLFLTPLECYKKICQNFVDEVCSKAKLLDAEAKKYGFEIENLNNLKLELKENESI